LTAAPAALKDARSAAQIQPSARILEHVTGHGPGRRNRRLTAASTRRKPGEAGVRNLAAEGEIADLVWEAPADLTAEHGRLCQAAIRARQAGKTKAGEQVWQQAQALWSQAWSANYQAMELLQNVGLTRFSAVKPQRWVIASFEHYRGPHGLPQPHIHNIVITALITGTG
jgi:hypothetical protein